MCVISDFVNGRVCHHRGRVPPKNRALQSFIAAILLRDRALGIETITAASVCTGVPRAYVQAARQILQSENTELALDVLRGREPLLDAAKRIRNRAKLIQSFRASSPEDRVALGNVVGVATIWDSTIMPSI